MSAIWTLTADGEWRLLKPSRYLSEAALHDLVEQAPQVLPLAGSPHVTVVGREVQLGGGRADLVAVESSGRLVLIEVKLASNTQSRRAIVAQVLSYASHLHGLDAAHLERGAFAMHLRRRAVTNLIDAVRGQDHEQPVNETAFNNALARSLAEGEFRLVIVLDDVPEKLVQLAAYLQSLTDKVIVDLIAISSYEVGGSTVLAPRRVKLPHDHRPATTHPRRAAVPRMPSRRRTCSVTDCGSHFYPRKRGPHICAELVGESGKIEGCVFRRIYLDGRRGADVAMFDGLRWTYGPLPRRPRKVWMPAVQLARTWLASSSDKFDFGLVAA